jgi:hypothetical protein
VYYTKLDATFGTATGLKNIQMIPKLSILDMNLQPVTVVNPGIGYQLSAKFSNGAGFCMASQCSYEGYSWTILPSNVTCSGCSGTPNDLVIINVPTNINSASITAGANYNCSSQSYLLQGLSIPVKLKTPSITANSNYGCSNSPYNPSNTFLFTASPVIGASSYSWTFTSSLFAISSQNQVTTGSFIYLDVIGTGSGNVSVQAMSGGNVANSNVLNFPVSICCIPSKSVTGNIDISNSPFFEESGTRLESTNNILSTPQRSIQIFIVDLVSDFVFELIVIITKQICNQKT